MASEYAALPIDDLVAFSAAIKQVSSSEAEAADRAFSAAVPDAAAAIVELAREGKNEYVRAKCAMYIIDRQMGKPSENPIDDRFKALYESITSVPPTTTTIKELPDETAQDAVSDSGSRLE